MNLKREKERYPFIIADEEGKVLLSAPGNAFREENIFSPDNIDRADILFIGECIRTFVLDSPIAVQSGDGKLWIVSLAAFPSARVFYVIVTDLEYDKAAPIIEQSFKYVKIRNSELSLPKNYKKILTDLPNALHVACALGELNTAENTAERIEETINICSRLVGCGCSSNIMHISSLPLENFDFGIFTLFLFTVFSYSFDIAPDRSCNISIFSEAAIQYGDIKFRADIEIPKDLSNKDITLMSSKLHTYLRRICAINNIPLSFIADICVSIEIIPVRPEVSLLGLKEEEFYLRGSLSKDSDIIS